MLDTQKNDQHLFCWRQTFRQSFEHEFLRSNWQNQPPKGSCRALVPQFFSVRGSGPCNNFEFRWQACWSSSPDSLVFVCILFKPCTLFLVLWFAAKMATRNKTAQCIFFAMLIVHYTLIPSMFFVLFHYHANTIIVTHNKAGTQKKCK